MHGEGVVKDDARGEEESREEGVTETVDCTVAELRPLPLESAVLLGRCEATVVPEPSKALLPVTRSEELGVAVCR